MFIGQKKNQINLNTLKVIAQIHTSMHRLKWKKKEEKKERKIWKTCSARERSKQTEKEWVMSTEILH